MKKNIFYKLLILLPIIDLITSLSRRFFDINITFGLIIKILFALILIVYIIFFKKDDKKSILIFLFYMLAFITVYFILKYTHVFQIDNFKNELIYLFRYLFYPTIFYLLYYLISKEKTDEHKLKISLIISLVIYMAIILLSQLTKSSFNSYVGDNVGVVGWYYAANEISIILVMLFPFVYYLLEKNRKILFYLIGLSSVFIISTIGTKVSSLGIIITSILFVVLPLLFKQNIKYSYKQTVPFFVVTLFIMFGSSSVFNLKTAFDKINEEYQIKSEECIELGSETIPFCNEHNNEVISMLLSGRDKFLFDTYKIYKSNCSIKNLLFGIDMSNSTEIDNLKISKWIEMDFFDIFFHYGLIGIIIVLSPIFFCVYLTLKKRILFKKLNFESSLYILIIGLVLSVSFISGHVISAPASSIYLIIYQLLYLKSINGLRQGKIMNINKVSILSLHLGYGGIEQANVNLANMLCNKYEVELISLYKTVDEVPYKINDKVKLIYLSKLKPNKKEFKSAVRDKKILKVFIEGLIAVKILFYKRFLMAKYIINSDSKYVISSRIEFTKQLSFHGRDDMIKIAQEHRHHNNEKKYIRKLKKSLLNIDYLIPVSIELTNFYKEEFKDIKKLNVVYVKHALYYCPKNANNYNDKRIISVGRLSYEKGFDDLIEVFKEINKKNKGYSFVIVGSGDQEEVLKEKINLYKLNKKITLTGFLNKEKIHENYSKCSIFVSGARSEAFGLVIIEAMSFGIPCLAFDSAQGAREIIDGKNGVLIKDRNIKAMAKEVVSIMADREKYKLISEHARKKSAQYQTNKVRKEWYNLLERN